MSVMALGFTPRYGNRYISHELISAWVRDVGGNFQKQLEHFLKACLKINPNDRPNIDDIKRQTLFSDIIWEELYLLRKQPPYSFTKQSAWLESDWRYSQTYKDAVTADDGEFSDHIHVTMNHRLRLTISLPADLNVFRGDNRPPFLTNEI